MPHWKIRKRSGFLPQISCSEAGTKIRPAFRAGIIPGNSVKTVSKRMRAGIFRPCKRELTAGELSCFVPAAELSCFVPARVELFSPVELFRSCYRVELFSPVELSCFVPTDELSCFSPALALIFELRGRVELFFSTAKLSCF
ncbi:hypothetical protein TNCV_243701 [Trichonephila clavipes]|nr:hypothetical protein TNCV_243701 [Trichonephila clavipes]